MPDESEKGYPLTNAKLSKTPSWIMLGFLLGAAFVVALPPLKRPAPPARPEADLTERPSFRPDQAQRSEPRTPQITLIEAVFAAWHRYAVWAPDGTTQVALWNIEERDYTDYFEVIRSGGEFYFRTLPSLSRRVMQRGSIPAECPLKFTETEEHYRDWIERNTSQPVVAPSRPRPPTSRNTPSQPVKLEPSSGAAELPSLPPPDTRGSSAAPGSGK